VITVQNFDTCSLCDVTCGDDARAFGIDRQALGPFDFHFQRHALEVQNDVGDVFAYTGDARELVQNVVNLNAGDRCTLQRRQQNAAQRVTERQTKATLEGFGNNSRLARGIIARLYL